MAESVPPEEFTVVGRREDPESLADAILLNVRATLALSKAVMALRDAILDQKILNPFPPESVSDVGDALERLSEAMDRIMIYQGKKS